MSEKFPLIIAKVERAKEHFDNLSIFLQTFLQTNPYVISAKDNDELRQRTYYLESVKDVPLSVVTMVGDLLHNLRSALDHLAYHLVLAAGNIPDRKTYFPIAASAEEYVSKVFRRKVQGMREKAIETIDALKPYKGGNDTLWTLHELNNIDKHRLLLAVTGFYMSREMTPSERAEIANRFRGSRPNDVAPDFQMFFMGVHPPILLKTGGELLTVPYSEMNDQMKFTFHVAFNEPQILKAQPLIVPLHEMTQLVWKIVCDFDPLLG